MWNKLYRINRKEEVRSSVISTIIMIGVILSDLVVLTVSVLDVIAKKIGIGDLQYNLSMVARLRSEAQSLAYNTTKFLNNNQRLTELQEFIAIKPESEKSGTLIPSKNPKIEFCNVTFKYPNAEQYVLKNCSLQ